MNRPGIIDFKGMGTHQSFLEYAAMAKNLKKMLTPILNEIVASDQYASFSQFLLHPALNEQSRQMQLKKMKKV